MRRFFFVLICALTLSLVPIFQAHAGTCFKWNADGTSTCVSNVTADACTIGGGWEHVQYLPSATSGCSTVVDGIVEEKLPWEDDAETPGDTLWRYVVVVYCGPNCDPRNECDLGFHRDCCEYQILYKCKILWSEAGA